MAGSSERFGSEVEDGPKSMVTEDESVIEKGWVWDTVLWLLPEILTVT